MCFSPDLRLGSEDGMSLDRSRLENAAPASLHHDDGLRSVDVAVESDETAAPTICDQAAQS